jgi:hypothetical protein
MKEASSHHLACKSRKETEVSLPECSATQESFSLSRGSQESLQAVGQSRSAICEDSKSVTIWKSIQANFLSPFSQTWAKPQRCCCSFLPISLLHSFVAFFRGPQIFV